MSYTYDVLLKYIVVGDVGCGKTSLLARFVQPQAKWTDHYEPTLGLEFGSKTIRLADKQVKIMVWDTAGQEMFRSIIRSYYRGAISCLLVFDISSRSSFANVENWLSEVRNCSNPSLQIYLIGNKCDLYYKRQVSTQEAEDLAEENDLAGYYEVSAKENINVESCFVDSTADILRKIEEGSIDINEENIGVKFTKGDKPILKAKRQEQGAIEQEEKEQSNTKVQLSSQIKNQSSEGCMC